MDLERALQALQPMDCPSDRAQMVDMVGQLIGLTPTCTSYTYYGVCVEPSWKVGFLTLKKIAV